MYTLECFNILLPIILTLPFNLQLVTCLIASMILAACLFNVLTLMLWVIDKVADAHYTPVDAEFYYITVPPIDNLNDNEAPPKLHATPVTDYAFSVPQRHYGNFFPLNVSYLNYFGDNILPEESLLETSADRPTLSP